MLAFLRAFKSSLRILKIIMQLLIYSRFQWLREYRYVGKSGSKEASFSVRFRVILRVEAFTESVLNKMHAHQ